MSYKYLRIECPHCAKGEPSLLEHSGCGGHFQMNEQALLKCDKDDTHPTPLIDKETGFKWTCSNHEGSKHADIYSVKAAMAKLIRTLVEDGDEDGALFWNNALAAAIKQSKNWR